MIKVLLLASLGLLFVPWFANAEVFTQESEKDFALRSLGQLQVINPKGDISVQGWALDKIRIKVKKKVQAKTLHEADELFGSIDYRFQISDRDIEVSTRYGDALGVAERLRDRASSKVTADLTIFAPSKLALKLWTILGNVTLHSWNEVVDIRAGSGLVRVEDAKAKSLSLTCSSCSAQLRDINASLLCLGGSGQMDLGHVEGKSIYVETDSGPIRLFQVEGNQIYLSKTGLIDGQFLKGRIEFSTRQGAVQFKEVSGFISGSSESGNILANIRNWRFSDKALIESTRGDIELLLPPHFSAEVDIWSLHGDVEVGFPIQKAEGAATLGPQPPNRHLGRVKDGGELLKIFSDSGKIRVVKGKL